MKDEKCFVPFSSFIPSPPLFMPTDIEQIVLVKSQTLDRMAEITAEPKPTYQIDGQLVSWGNYLLQLQRTVDWCNEKLVGEAPFEVHSQGYT